MDDSTDTKVEKVEMNNFGFVAPKETTVDGASVTKPPPSTDFNVETAPPYDEEAKKPSKMYESRRFYKRSDFWVKGTSSLYGTSYATNKVSEAFFGIFALYVLIEYGNFVDRCDSAMYSKCVGQFITQSNESESDFWLRDCNEMALECEVNPIISEATETRNLFYTVGENRDSDSDRFDIETSSYDSDELADGIKTIPIIVDFFGLKLYQANVSSPFTWNKTDVCLAHFKANEETPDKFSSDRCAKKVWDEPTCKDMDSGGRKCKAKVVPCFDESDGVNNTICTENVMQSGVADSIWDGLIADPKSALFRLNMCACFEYEKENKVTDEACLVQIKLYLLLLFGVTGIVLLELTAGEDDEFSRLPHDGEDHGYEHCKMSLFRGIVLIADIAYFIWLYFSFAKSTCNAPEFVRTRQSTEIMAVCALVLSFLFVFIELITFTVTSAAMCIAQYRAYKNK
eukprot:m.16354 g.16354  ORF g.16354 m.16354 type:complete len:456 (-) comp5680_c0_seq1:18-1385(-)